MQNVSTGALIKPLVVGGGFSTGGVLISFMEAVTPYLQFASLTMGLAIGMVTLYRMFKYRDVRKIIK